MPPAYLILKKYSFLLDFMEFRLVAALILEQINLVKSDIDPMIQQDAVSMEIQKMEETRKSIKDVHKFADLLQSSRRPSKLSKTKLSKRNMFLIQHSTLHCRYTLVCHPVGMHYDSFGKQENKDPKFSLENKRCFVHSKLSSKLSSNGRGGLGGSTYVFALLDW